MNKLRCLIVFSGLLLSLDSFSQLCSGWLHLTSQPAYAQSAEIDITGDQITVEAKFTRTTPYSGGAAYAGDLVSKHKDPTDANYLLRPNGAEITTTNGYFKTPDICEIELNKTYHAAMVYDGATLKFYRNGFLMSQVAATGYLVQNNWKTRIGFYEPAIHPENFIGYIDEVRIWNVARSQSQIRAYLNSSLPSPASQTGLLAYYTFEDLVNKQGNAAYNLTLSSNASANQMNSACAYIADSCGIEVQPRVILTNDTTVCKGASVKLRARDALAYVWVPATYLDNPTAQDPVSTPQDSITYYVTALVQADNLIINGDFSQGNTGFTSGYNNANPNVSEGEYYVGSSPHTWNTSLSSCGDHTSSNGKLMLVNGSPAPNIEVWKQVVPVTPHTDYAFSTWIEALWPPNPAILSFSINGVELGSPITASLPTCHWSQFYTTWNSGANTSATIAIINKNTAIQGNDFALDDITFSPYVTMHDSVTIRVEQTNVVANNDTSVCAGRPVPLNASGGATYTWSPVDGLSSSTTPNPIATPSSTTQYIVTGTSSFGCSAKDTVNINILSKPSVQISNDTQVCAHSSIQLNASGGTAYQWSPATGLSDPNIPNPFANVEKNQKYTVTVTGSNTCTNTDSVSITVRPYPGFAASGDMSTCQGIPVTLTARGGDKYLWTPATSLTTPASSSTSANPSTTTSYSVYIQDSVCHFDSTISMTVRVNAIPSVAVQKSNDIDCNTPTATLTASGAQNYLWSPASALDHSDRPVVVASVDETTEFTVRATSEAGCTGSASLTVNVGNGGIPRFVVPNAFTPNGDGKNDCFGIRRWGNTKLRKFSIYNRWGQIVFQTTDPSKCWDGTFNGQQQDSGSYAYIIEGVTICGTVSRKGTLLLIR